MMKLLRNPPLGEIVLESNKRTGIATYCTGLVKAWRRHQNMRRDRRLLLEMDDRLLKDIGLSRDEVRRMTLHREESRG